MLLASEPLLQWLPVRTEDVRVTLPFPQKVVGPPAVMTGVTGSGFTVTFSPMLIAEVQPCETALTV